MGRMRAPALGAVVVTLVVLVLASALPNGLAARADYEDGGVKELSLFRAPCGSIGDAEHLGISESKILSAVC